MAAGQAALKNSGEKDLPTGPRIFNRPFVCLLSAVVRFSSFRDWDRLEVPRFATCAILG